MLVPALVIKAGLALGLSLVFPADAPFVGWPAFLGVVVVALVFTVFQAAAEEYVFRGWLVQAVGSFVRNPVPVCCSALFCSRPSTRLAVEPVGVSWTWSCSPRSSRS